MRPVDVKKILAGFLFLLDRPWAEKAYEDLKDLYKCAGMENDSDAFESLIKERFNGHNSNSNEE